MCVCVYTHRVLSSCAFSPQLQSVTNPLPPSFKAKHLFVPTSLCAHVSLCPRLYTPRKVVFCAHVSLCPKKWYFVPTSLCAHVSLCPKKWYFVPTSLCAHVSICPNLCQWELWVGSLNRPVVKQWLN